MTRETIRILLIEDEPNVCHIVKSYLNRKGFYATTATSGSEALAIIETLNPHIVLLDLILPDMEGKEILELLSKRHPKIKVIVVTGNLLSQDELSHLQSLGISGFLHKPIVLEQLDKSILSVLNDKVLPPDKNTPHLLSLGQPHLTRALSHDLSNIICIIRSQCENFILDIEEGIYRNKSDKELLEGAMEVMRVIEKAADRASVLIDKLSERQE